MKVTNKDILEGADKRQHLLDISSDYNNYSNLAHFVSEYKKAKRIIVECKNFYEHFLRNKLYTLEELQNIENVNLLQFKFSWELYKQNCKNLYLFIVYQDIAEQVNKNLKNYHFEFRQEGTHHAKYYSNEPCYNVWDIICEKDSLLSLVDDKDYFDYFTQIYLLHQYKTFHSTDQLFNRYHFFDDVLECSHIKEGVKIKFKTIKLDLYDSDGWGENKKITKSKNKIEVIKFGEEELQLVNIFKETGEKYKNLLEDIKLNPSDYIEQWNSFVIFKKNNYKKISDNISSTEYLLCPVEYQIDETKYYIDAYEYLNFDFIKYYHERKKYDGFEYERKEKSKIYNSLYESLINSTFLLNKSFIKNTELLYHIQKINPEYYKCKNILTKYIDKVVNYSETSKEFFDPVIPNNNNFYYVLIDNIPYKFCDNLSDVRIEYDELDNRLKCVYTRNYKYKKWQWPSDSPWTINTNGYILVFDCSTNEPIYYNYKFDTHEEKVKYKY